MRKLTAFFTLFFFPYILLACSCSGGSTLCNHSKYIEEKGTGFIAIGKTVEEEMGMYYVYYKVEIEEILLGSIDTTLVKGKYRNSEKYVWIQGGSSSSCLRYLPERRIVIAPLHFGPENGYSLSICLADYFEVEKDDMIYGLINNSEKAEKIHLSQISKVFDTECTTSLTEFQRLIDDYVWIDTPLSSGIIFLTSFERTKGIKYFITNSEGKFMKEGVLDVGRKELDVENFSSGVYIISFSDGNHIYSKKIVKI